MWDLPGSKCAMCKGQMWTRSDGSREPRHPLLSITAVNKAYDLSAYTFMKHTYTYIRMLLKLLRRANHNILRQLHKVVMND